MGEQRSAARRVVRRAAWHRLARAARGARVLGRVPGALAAAIAVGCADAGRVTGTPAARPAAGARVLVPSAGPSADAAGGAVASRLAPGKCLDVAGARTDDGAPVILWPCHGGANQRFTATADGALVVYAGSGAPKCLDASGGALRDGDPFIIWSCHGGANQRWALAADGTVRGAAGKCLDLPAFAAADGTQPVAWACNGGDNQRWEAPPACEVGAAPAGARVLVFTRTTGFRHESIPAAVRAVEALGAGHGFAVDHTEDPAAFADANLARYAAVAFVLTTGDVLGAAEEAALERYVRGGGGFVGVHSAADTEYDWPWYGRLVGAYFRTHGPIEGGVVAPAADHPSARCAPAAWSRVDEWYEFRSPPVDGATVLATVDRPAPHPIAWAHANEGGRAWYTGLGHTAESYAEPAFLRHLAGGIVWAAGR